MKPRFTLVALGSVALLAQGQKENTGPPPGFVQNQLEVPVPPLTESMDKTAADYTEEARIAELEGTVRVDCTIGDDGHPHNPRVIETLGLGLDELALKAVMEESFGASALGRRAIVAVRYHLPSKYSRWHLIHAEFQPPEGASLPQFVRASYPTGAGILSSAAVAEGRLLGAMGREGTAAIAFVIDERGVAGRFQVVNASEIVWGQEAIALLSEWRFKPGRKDDKAIAVPAKFEVAWGPRELNPERITRLRQALDPASSPFQETVVTPRPWPTQAVEILKQVQPTYSQEALDAKLEGAVIVSLDTQSDGTPTNLRVVQGLGKGLDEKALEALSQWRFKPLFLNGVFSPSEVTLRVDFRLK